MEHFAKSIDGWFDDGDFEFYKFAINHLKENLEHIVEVGCYRGRSSSFMAVELSKLNKKVKFDCVDTWKGSEEHKDVELVKIGRLFDEFLSNMDPVKEYYTPKRMYSIEAAKEYPDNSLDMVYIDASHDYENIKADLEAWYPKIKIGGIIAGHDYSNNWPEVIQAVNDFTINPIIFPNCTTWYKIKK